MERTEQNLQKEIFTIMAKKKGQFIKGGKMIWEDMVVAPEVEVAVEAVPVGLVVALVEEGLA